jgi:hypothetical protein
MVPRRWGGRDARCEVRATLWVVVGIYVEDSEKNS